MSNPVGFNTRKLTTFMIMGIYLALLNAWDLFIFFLKQVQVWAFMGFHNCNTLLICMDILPCPSHSLIPHPYHLIEEPFFFAILVCTLPHTNLNLGMTNLIWCTTAQFCSLKWSRHLHQSCVLQVSHFLRMHAAIFFSLPIFQSVVRIWQSKFRIISATGTVQIR